MSPSRAKRDVIIVGGGHNGLVSAAYLAQKGLDVLVLERRHVLGEPQGQRLILANTAAPPLEYLLRPTRDIFPWSAGWQVVQR